MMLAKTISQGNIWTDLLDKYAHDQSANISTFQCRVEVVTNNFLMELNNPGALYYSCDIFNADTKERLQGLEIKITQQNDIHKISQRFVEALITCALSGCYASSEDEARLIRAYNESKKKGERHYAQTSHREDYSGAFNNLLARVGNMFRSFRRRFGDTSTGYQTKAR